MGRKSHLTLKEKKKAIEGLIEEKSLRVIAKEIDRSKGAIENVKENNLNLIRTNKDEILNEVGLTPKYIIQTVKDDLERLPTDKFGNIRREQLIDISCKISGLYSKEDGGEIKNEITVVDKQINIILNNAESEIKRYLEQQIREGKTNE